MQVEQAVILIFPIIPDWLQQGQVRGEGSVEGQKWRKRSHGMISGSCGGDGQQVSSLCHRLAIAFRRIKLSAVKESFSFQSRPARPAQSTDPVLLRDAVLVLLQPEDHHDVVLVPVPLACRASACVAILKASFFQS